MAFVLPFAGTAARAAIAYDNASSATAAASNTVSFDHAIGDGMNRLLVVTLALEDTVTGDLAVNAITYNGAAMTLVASSQAQTTSGSTITRGVMYYLLDASLPASGTHGVSITFGGTVNGIVAGAVSLTGVKQQAAEAVATGTATSTTTVSTSITTISRDAWIISVLSNSSATTTFAATTANMVERLEGRTATNSGATATKPGPLTPAASAMAWSMSGGGNRSAHSLAAFAEATVAVSGRVFEDVDYSGGAGRDETTSNGVARSAARVELYNAAGAFLAFTTTSAAGDFSFNASANSACAVRVVNSTVTSSLGGTSLRPVQTFRTDASSGSVAPVTDRVGGEAPTLIDAGNGSTTLAALTTATLTPQSITSITTASSDFTNVDFGFNFCTIVNTANTGQGSLRQFITNANAMSGTQTSIFAISDGNAHACLRAGLANQLTSGVAIFNVTTSLPALSTAIVIDGTSQTTNVGDTNVGTLGVGGSVGVDGASVAALSRPEVEIIGNSAINYGFSITGASTQITGIAIHGFGSTISTGNIRVSAANDVVISGNVIGASAASFSAPSAATGGSGIPIASGNTGTISNNLIGFAAFNGVYMASTASTSWQIFGNEIRGNGTFNATYGGIDVKGVTNTVSGNLIIANKGAGVDLNSTTGGPASIVNNTITGNGVGTAGTPITAGIRVRTNTTTIDRNRITANYGAGVMVRSGTTAAKMTRNSIYANGTITNDASAAATGQVGIDLNSSSDSTTAGTSPFRTLNDSTDTDSGGNALFNFPIIETATIVGSNLELTGWVASGATVEFFISDSDPGNFGEGETFIGSFVEGGGSDLDATASSYSGNVNCFAQGAGTNVARFKFVTATPVGIAVETILTATATSALNYTSEFSGQVTVHDNFPDFTLVKSAQTISDPINGSTNPKAIPGAFLLYDVIITNTDAARNDTDTLVFTDVIPAQTQLYVGDIGGAGSGPVTFTNGTTTSSMTYTFTSLASTTDNLSFSNDNGATWTYTPVADANGCDASVTNIRVNPTGSFAKAACGNNPSCTLRFRVRVK